MEGQMSVCMQMNCLLLLSVCPFPNLFQHAGQSLMVFKDLRLPVIADIEDLALEITEGKGGGLKGRGGGGEGGRGRGRGGGGGGREGGGKEASFLGRPVRWWCVHLSEEAREGREDLEAGPLTLCLWSGAAAAAVAAAGGAAAAALKAPRRFAACCRPLRRLGASCVGDVVSSRTCWVYVSILATKIRLER